MASRQPVCNGCKEVLSIVENVLPLKDSTTWENGSYLVSHLSHIKEGSDCSGCQFFWTMKWGGDPDPHTLYAFSVEDVLNCIRMLVKNVYLLGVVPSKYSNISPKSAMGFSDTKGFIAVTFRSVSDPKFSIIKPETLNPTHANYPLIRSWLVGYEGTYCGRPGEIPIEIPIELIDVQSREVIKSPEEPPVFAALSYVWGKTGQGSTTLQVVDGQRRLPDQCARTVEDAIVVTQRLGIKYLWVDAYCVSKDPALRHAQIARMDLVYKTAFVCIIAAAGDDAAHGLPGVSRPRDEPTTYQTDTLGLRSIRLNTRSQIGGSWSKRGWTYQERLFSSRRLYFTSTQVLLENSVSTCFESFTIPHWHTRRPSPISSLKDLCLRINDPEGLELLYSTLESGKTPLTFSDVTANFATMKSPTVTLFQKHVKQYSFRRLTYKSDIMNAIYAVLEQFKHEYYPVLHIWGVPYEPSSLRPERAHLFSWTFANGLTWSSFNCVRRLGFPSWSWAGWEGAIHWDDRDCTQADIEGRKQCLYCDAHREVNGREVQKGPCDIKLKSLTGEVYNLPSMFNQSSRLGEQPRLLHITSDVIQVNLQGSGENVCLMNTLDTTAGEEFKVPRNSFHYRQSQEHPVPSLALGMTGRLFAIRIGHRHQTLFRLNPTIKMPCRITLLVVPEPRIEGDWTERVGLLEVDPKWYKEQMIERRTFVIG